MEETQINTPEVSCNCSEAACQCQPVQKETDFDIARTFTLLMVTLVLPMYLAISVVSYSMAAIY